LKQFGEEFTALNVIADPNPNAGYSHVSVRYLCFDIVVECVLLLKCVLVKLCVVDKNC